MFVNLLKTVSKYSNSSQCLAFFVSWKLLVTPTPHIEWRTNVVALRRSCPLTESAGAELVTRTLLTLMKQVFLHVSPL